MRTFFLTLLLFPFIAFSQRGPVHTTDPKNQKPMLVGHCRLADLKGPDYVAWFEKEYGDYKTDEATLAAVRPLMKGVKVVLVMGTWCSDSRREVPRFYKILDHMKIKPKKKLRVISIDREKKAEGTGVEKFDVQYVPTFIFYRNDKELGRIIETPAESLEKDMLKILGG